MPDQPDLSSVKRRRYEGDFALDTPGQRIKFLRKQKGLSQAALAAMCYTSQPAVSQWETDGCMPSRQSQKLIADALDVPRMFIFGEVAA